MEKNRQIKPQKLRRKFMDNETNKDMETYAERQVRNEVA